LAADFVFAIVIQENMELHVRQGVTIVNPFRFPAMNLRPDTLAPAYVMALRRSKAITLRQYRREG
jgi:hypothetical protein